MWVCKGHLKEVLAQLDTPHISKAPYRIQCSFCSSEASAKLYYTHHPFLYRRKSKALYYLANIEEKQSS
ncbi:hypothetical protein [Bacillus thermotolerans]|uniref:hypothetical protein n=1 Tax=Bacillus thermotolerans TaxID=1221996 RepID=UPI00057C8B1E|nr:hypothetical protein [Bacillus thermotolerans]KKB36628.1 hypothetical protein QY97_00800 [Bacillus thermotolerans]